MKKIFAVTILIFILFSVYPQSLEYIFNVNDVLSIESNIAYNIYLNGKYLNKFSSQEISRHLVVSEKNGKAGIKSELTVIDFGDDFGRYRKSKSYKYSFTKDKFGKTKGLENINGLHDFPYFPSKTLKPGDTWIASSIYNMPLYHPAQGISIELQVQYMLLGTEKISGNEIATISANAVFVKDKNADILAQYEVFKVAGYCNFLVKFNRTKGVMVSMEEIFDYFYVLYDTSIVEVSGNSGSNAHYYPADIKTDDNMDFDKNDDIKVTIEKDRTIIITLINVKFLSDSKILLEPEKKRLDRVAEVIKKKYKNKKIVITGHAASTGKPRAEMDLSEERAKEVLSYLVKKHGFNPDLLSYEGKGSTEPKGDNNTEAGKSQNRRVEIKILPD